MNLNKSQLQAVCHDKGPMMVLAGPGSGKTMVITHRVKWLIEHAGVHPAGILVVTFTKAAADEMRQRFVSLMGGRTMPVSFGTFHAIFFSVLKHAYNYTASNIIREEQKQQLIREIIEDMPATMEERDTKYYSVFHGAENKKFHDQLSLKVCEKLVPLVEKLLLRARQKDEIQFDDIQAAAMFCVYGQLGVLLADDLTQEDKSKRIREFLIFALHL